MRRTPRRWSSALLALGICALMARTVAAEPVFDPATSEMTPLTTTATAITYDGQTSLTSYNQYVTSGTIGSTGIDGTAVVRFEGIGDTGPGFFTAPSAFSLGTFVVDPLAVGQTTTYDQTPFSITFTTQQVDGLEPSPNETPLTITGVLNGKVSGPRQSNVVAMFDPVIGNPFQTGSFMNTLSVLDTSRALVPSTSNGGRTTAQGRVVATTVPVPVPVPEPASISLLAIALGGVAIRRRVRRGRPNS